LASLKGRDAAKIRCTVPNETDSLLSSIGAQPNLDLNTIAPDARLLGKDPETGADLEH
jgi:hypothetical protein